MGFHGISWDFSDFSWKFSWDFSTTIYGGDLMIHKGQMMVGITDIPGRFHVNGRPWIDLTTTNGDFSWDDYPLF